MLVCPSQSRAHSLPRREAPAERGRGSPSRRPAAWRAETGAPAQAGACCARCPRPEPAGGDCRAGPGLGAADAPCALGAQLKQGIDCYPACFDCVFTLLCVGENHFSPNSDHWNRVRENEAFATFSILVQEYSFFPINRGSQTQSFRVSSYTCFILVPSLCCLYLLFLFLAFLHQLKRDQIQVVSF